MKESSIASCHRTTSKTLPFLDLPLPFHHLSWTFHCLFTAFRYVTLPWNPANKTCAEFANCSNPPRGETWATWVTTPCYQGDMNTLGNDTKYTNCTAPVTPAEYKVFQPPGQYVTRRCQQGDMHTEGNDTMIDACQIRETPLIETRLRNHGTGNDGPVHARPGQTYLINHDRWKCEGTADNKNLAIISGGGFVENGEVVIIHQTLVNESTLDFAAGDYEFAIVFNMTSSFIVLMQPLTRSYSSSDGNAAQVVRVDELTSVLIESGGKMTTAPWDGESGGILAFLATGILNVYGSINADAIGYRGVPRQDNKVRHCRSLAIRCLFAAVP